MIKFPITYKNGNYRVTLLEDGTKISVRPSGTEPKIKFYFEVREKLNSLNEFFITEEKANKKIDGIIDSLKLN